MSTTASEQGQELAALSAFELSRILSDIDDEMGRLVSEANAAEAALAKAETILIFEPANLQAKVDAKRERRLLNVAERTMKSLRHRQSRVQSLLKVCAI